MDETVARERGGVAGIRAAEVVVPCAELGATLAFFTDRLGFRVEAIIPADDPAVAVIAGHGVRLRLERGAAGTPPTLRIRCEDVGALAGDAAVIDGVALVHGPGGARVILAPARPPIAMPPLEPGFIHSRAGADARWVIGRAGMAYRDLIPGRQGGRFIASQIRIAEGGPVADYVHYHRIRFQMIYCHRGWVRLVYEDQGPTFVMRAGECVLQPPEIRHRVLESSPGLEVIEIGCPADHETHADPALSLPNDVLRPEHRFGGQRFVFHQASAATWEPWRSPGYEVRDLGIAAATEGVVRAEVVRRRGAAAPIECAHSGELRFVFVLAGAATLDRPGDPPRPLGADDAIVIPAGEAVMINAPAEDLELLIVDVPA